MAMKKRGFVLSLDAIISLVFILVIFMTISAFRFTETSETSRTAFVNLHYTTEDILDVLNRQDVLDEVGEYWTSGNESLATNISRDYLDDLVPEHMGYRLLFDNTRVVENQRTNEANAVSETHAVRLLAGYTENETPLGSVSRAFLTGITEKTSSAYAYFGGFIGQGDITRYLYVPSEVTINDAYMEMDAGSQFNLFVNGEACNNPHSPSGGYLSADIKEDISGCAFTTGRNTLEIEFTGSDSDYQFIGGGFVRVEYNSSQFNESDNGGSDTYEFPGIDGFINLYSSFYVPGTLNSMNIHLEYDNNYTTFLKIGDTLVYNSTGSGSTQTVDLDNTYLENKLNYNALSDNTIPLRFGTSNVTDVVQAGNADVILITDLSGSMMYPIGAESGTGDQRDCDDSNLLDDSTRRISLAKCLDIDFTEMILNNSGNRVGLVGFNSDADDYHSLSTDYDSLISEIEGYPDNPSGGTCLCCAINRAYNILNSESDPEKDKFIIVMSDGIASYCCGVSGWWWWASCDSEGTSTTGQYNDCDGGSSDCTGTQCDGAIDNAIWSAQRAYDNIPATVHSIGFGPVDSCENANYTMHQVAEVGNGSYCASDDPASLQDCYVNFAEDIVEGSKISQIVNLSGSVTPSTLYPSSYISYEYAPNSAGLEYGEVELSYDTNRFEDNVTCEGSFYIPSSVDVTEAKVTSYSSEHWTHFSSIYNSDGTRVTYRLSDYGSDYYVLGDPYIVNIPADYINSGENNTVTVTTGDSPDNSTGCSADNRAILAVKMQGSTPYGDVFSRADGCNWELEFEDGSTNTGSIPSDYSGASTCYYTSTNTTYYEDDAINDAVRTLLERLDWDNDGELDIKFDPQQVSIDSSSIGGVRSLWGPAKLKLVLWI